MPRAMRRGMGGAKHFRELVAWQPARQLRVAVYSLTSRPGACRDFAFKQQLHDSARSPARNIAEGFGRFRPRDFSRFLTIASASLNETENHLEDGIDLGYWSQDDLKEVLVLCKRTGSAIGGLQRYLSSCDPKFDTGRVPERRKRAPGTHRTPRTPGTPGTRTEPKEPVEPKEPEEP